MRFKNSFSLYLQKSQSIQFARHALPFEKFVWIISKVLIKMIGLDILQMELLWKAKIVLKKRSKSKQLQIDTYKSVSRVKRRNVPSAIAVRSLK